MDPQILAFVLLFCGFVLILAELFLPSGGLIAVMCVACFAGAIYCAYKAWYVSNPSYWWMYLGSVAVLIPAGVIGAFRILTHTSFGNRVLLAAPSEEEVTPYQREEQHLSSLIGARGTALNLMTPGGLVKVKGERLHAISDGLMIEPNTEIEIIAVRGTRVVVRPVEEGSNPSVAFEEGDQEQDSDPWPPNHPS